MWGVLRAQGGTQVSSLETEYSIRVTPACKTETIALRKLGLPAQWGQFHISGPCLRVQGHRGRQDRLLLP